MADLLFELFSEEIPARMQAGAARDLLKSLEAKLGEAGLSYASAESFYGPRRLTFSITGLPTRQEDRTEERKGPKEGAPEQAMQGFLRGAGLASLEEAELRDTGKGRVWFAVKHVVGLETRAVLPDLLLNLIRSHTWPKSQRWARTTFRWVRPLHRILAVFDGQTLDGSLDMGGGESIAFSDQAEGHRFLSEGTFAALSLDALEAGLKERHCLLRVEDRKAAIRSQLDKLCAESGLTLIEDEGLMNEVAGLAEWPVVVQGRFDEAFLNVPEECLILSMKEHQKYFAARVAGLNEGPERAEVRSKGPDGRLAPVFFTVSNMVADDGFAVIRAGNERVLNARLSDAKFFYEQDLATPLEDNLPKLEDIVFHAKLGSVGDKVRRMEALAAYLAGALGTDDGTLSAEAEKATRAVRLMKADLVSAMVYEFPELQGLMGRYYALAAGEDAQVANAIAAHYQPAGPNDDCPSDSVSLIVAMADKLDTLAGFWLIDQKPTGSKDPFALRRAALGIIRLIRENNLRLNLRDTLQAAASHYAIEGQIADEALAFVIERLAVQMRDEGAKHDVVQAVRFGSAEWDLRRFVKRAKTTQDRLTQDLTAAYKRASNILDKAKNWQRVETRPGEDKSDTAFGALLDTAIPKIGALMAAEDFGAVFDMLGGLREEIDQYFDAVMINAEDADLRNQRLSLLADFVDAVNQVADLSRLEG